MTQIKKIQVPIPHPIKWVNSYYIHDTSPTLIDTGVNTEDGFQAIRSGIERMGGTLSKLRRVIVTHGHIDHMGLAGRIIHESGAEACIHSWDMSKILIGPGSDTNKARLVFEGFFKEAGVPRDLSTRLTSSILLRLTSMNSPISRVTSLTGGEVFPFDDFDLQVVHTPGHSPGSVCLLNPVDSALFSGDSLLEELTLNPVTDLSISTNGESYRGLHSYRSTLKTLGEIPVNLVMPGHGRAYSELGERIEQLRAHHDHRSGQILNILRAKGSVTRPDIGMTQFMIAGTLFPSMNDIEVYHRIAAVRFHLEALESQGLVEKRRSEGGNFHYSSCVEMHLNPGKRQ